MSQFLKALEKFTIQFRAWIHVLYSKPGEEGGRSSLSAGPARWVVAAPLASGAVFSPLTVAGQVLSYASPRE